MNASCPNLDNLQAWQQGSLTGDEATAIAQHVGVCSLCRQALQDTAKGSKVDLPILKPPQAEGELGWLSFFRVLRQIGVGGMGMVLEAEDVRLQRHVALKVMKPELAADNVSRTRFLREARAVARLQNEHIVTIFHVGMEAEVPYLSMELLSGQSVRERLRSGGPVGVAELLRIAREMAIGLQAAHEAELIHRDIKPENIWLKPNGQVKILDFGLARFAAPMDNLTREGRTVGTPGYLSPEQARGQWVDGRSDLFSLGCVLYELATQRAPFERETIMASLTALAIEDPLPIREQNPGIPVALERLIMRLLAKKPDERPASAQAVLEELEHIEHKLAGHGGQRPSHEALQPAHEPFDLVEGQAADFQTEIRDLLRQRLKAMALICAIGIAWKIIKDLSWNNEEVLFFQVAVFAAELVAFAMLGSKRPFSMRQLRLLEGLVFGSICLYLIVVPSQNMLNAAAANAHGMAIAERIATVSTWSVVMVMYAFFIPTSWQRAALILLPLSFVPQLNISLLERFDADLRRAFAIPFFQMPLYGPNLVAVLGVYGAYIAGHLRYEAFRAQMLGQYVLKTKLGAGPLGEVFRAEHVHFKRPCAVKLIRPSATATAETLVRFERVWRVASTIAHGNIVTIYDYGRARDGTLYCVMELLPGMTCAAIVAEFGAPPPARVVHLLKQAAQALGEAHSFGFFHRNLKPSNLMVMRSGRAHDTLKLLDFGLDPDMSHKNVEAEAALYMSPEQITSGKIDARSDIYSLGAVAYHLLTGRPVFASSNLMQMVVAHARDEVEPPATVNPSVPTDLSDVILKCLAKEPDRRFARAEELIKALDQCQCAHDWDTHRAVIWWQNAT